MLIKALMLAILLNCALFSQTNTITFKQITSNEGLSQNFISAILQDKNGFMWFGTKDGLNRYDGYDFKVYRHDPLDINSLSGNFISSIFEDSKGRLWIGSNSLDLFVPEKDFFERINFNYKNNTNTKPVIPNQINAIVEDMNGLLWIGTNDGLLSFDPQFGTTRSYYQQQDSNTSLSDNLIISLMVDDSLLLIGSQNGLKLLNIEESKNSDINYEKIAHLPAGEVRTSKRTILSQYLTNSGELYAGTPSGLLKIDLQLKNSVFIPYKGHSFFPVWLNRILSIVRDQNGNLWLACSGGLVIYNPIKGSFRYYFHNPKDDKSLSMNSLTTLYVDRSQKIWIGTAGKGINVYDQNRKQFSLYDGLVDKEPFKSLFSISSILPDSKSHLWISSYQKLFRLNRSTSEYETINLLYGPEGEITSILEDNYGNIWVSSSGGLHKISNDGKSIKWFHHESSNPNSLRDNFVKLLFINNSGSLFAFNSRYLSKYDESSTSFIHYELILSDDKNYNPIIKIIYEALDGSLWFGTNRGLVKYELYSHEKTIYMHQSGNSNSLSSNEVLSICEDPVQPLKYLWIGTQGGGLSRLDLTGNTFSNFSVKDGLPNNVVYGILSSGNELWLSTNNGLCRVTTDKYGTPFFRNYDVTDGLQGNEFNTRAYAKSSSGELFFGGLNGVTAFFASEIRDNLYIPPVVITEVTFLKDRESDDNTYRQKINIISKHYKVVIPFSQNTFNVHFAALDFTATQKNWFMYKLKPLHDNWIDLGTQRNVIFTELSPGNYELIVRGSNNDGIWNEEGASLKIIITPPFWQTIWAYGIYAVLLILILYVIRRYELSRIRLKNRLKLESFETQKLKELDEMRSSFFANISHEFRTPLTLILSPAEQLEQNETDENKKEKLNTIKRSANRLLRLINQILDLSKHEKGKTKLHCEEGDLVSFVKGITMSFLTVAEKKNISLQFVSEASNIQTCFDRDIFEKVFYNLLSNAFKFTPQGGFVELKICQPVSGFCKISLKDSGVGINENDLPKVFNKFYTVENINGFSEQGSGIGLALVKELVEIHKGSITVESKINEGSTFTVSFPIGKEYLKEDEIVKVNTEKIFVFESSSIEFLDEKFVQTDFQNGNNDAKSTYDSLIALIVEDNSELRKYIAANLQSDYKVIEATTGKEGCEKAVEFIPDIILSDVMMPEMDGYSLCKKLKNDERTSHIPIILLTAKAGEEDKISGLGTGADDYLTKPFSSKELSIRVRNLIEIRQTLRKKFSSSLIIKPKEIATGSIDKLFLEKAMNIVEKNISNDKFSVEEFSSEMNLSHSQLHRKMKALVNKSAIQFIRSIRMQRALELLKGNSGNIAEIAWQVGFTDPSYFTKIFSKYFGYLPSEVNK